MIGASLDAPEEKPTLCMRGPQDGRNARIELIGLSQTSDR